MGCAGTVSQIRADVFLRLLDGRLTGLSTPEIIAALLADVAATANSATTGPAAADSGGAAGPASATEAKPASRINSAGPTSTAGADSTADPISTLCPDTAHEPGSPADAGRPVDAAGPDAVVPGHARGPADADAPEHARGGAEPDRPRGPVGGRLGTGPGRAEVAAGIEIGVGLLTLLGLDQRPGEIPGWGPVTHEVARAVVARQRRARWRFAILDDAGYLLLAGTTPPPTPPRPARPHRPAREHWFRPIRHGPGRRRSGPRRSSRRR